VLVGEGKGERSLEPFWELIGEKGLKKIECVAMDMGGACPGRGEKEHSEGGHRFRSLFRYRDNDRFHVVKLANTFLDDPRRREQTKLMFEGQRVLKGNRRLLLKNHESLSDEKGERERLNQLLALNKQLAQIYILKEGPRRFWMKESREGGRGGN
jgi:transposase